MARRLLYFTETVDDDHRRTRPQIATPSKSMVFAPSPTAGDLAKAARLGWSIIMNDVCDSADLSMSVVLSRRDSAPSAALFMRCPPGRAVLLDTGQALGILRLGS